MNSLSILKNTWLYSLLIVTVLQGTVSCNNQTRFKKNDTETDNNSNTEEGYDYRTNNQGDQADLANEGDAKFLQRATEINFEEINLGKLAQEKAQLAEVRELGAKMEKDHSANLNKLKALAHRLSITLPEIALEEAINTHKILKNTDPEEFDLEFCKQMVAGHQDAIDLYEKAAEESVDEGVREYARATLPDLRMHLEHSKAARKVAEKN